MYTHIHNNSSQSSFVHMWINIEWTFPTRYQPFKCIFIYQHYKFLQFSSKRKYYFLCKLNIWVNYVFAFQFSLKILGFILYFHICEWKQFECSNMNSPSSSSCCILEFFLTWPLSLKGHYLVDLYRSYKLVLTRRLMVQSVIWMTSLHLNLPGIFHF